MNESKIKAICFDLDGVYFTENSYIDFRLKLGGNDETYEVLKASEQIKRLRKGLISEGEFWDYAKKTLKLNLTNEQVFAMLCDSYAVNTQIVDIVRKVRKLGYKTCICSDNFITRVRELDKKFNFLNDFDVKVFSYEVGSFKADADKKMFKALIERSGVKPEELVYSDNDEFKLGGARELGVHTFLFENVEQFLEDLRKLGIKCI